MYNSLPSKNESPRSKERKKNGTHAAFMLGSLTENCIFGRQHPSRWWWLPLGRLWGVNLSLINLMHTLLFLFCHPLLLSLFSYFMYMSALPECMCAPSECLVLTDAGRELTENSTWNALAHTGDSYVSWTTMFLFHMQSCLLLLNSGLIMESKDFKNISLMSILSMEEISISLD